MKWTMACMAASVLFIAAGSSYAGYGPYGGILDGSGNAGCCGANCNYGYSLWNGFCSGADCAGCATDGCAGGGCGIGCQPGSFGGGWWYGGGPGCGFARLRGHSCGTIRGYGCGTLGGWGAAGCGGCGDAGGACCDGCADACGGCGGCANACDGCGGCNYLGCGGGGFGSPFQALAEKFRARMSCRSWAGGGPLDTCGLTDGFCNSGFNYNYINQWQSEPQPAPAAQPPVTGDTNSGSVDVTSPAPMGETMYESSQLGEELTEAPSGL